MSSPLEDYALIGDGQTAALVNRNGSIDWLCWPRFDSDACFCALLGADDNGRWSIAPSGAIASVSRRYEEDTLVLETEIETPDGTMRLTDFMPIRRGDLSAIIRIVEGLSGVVAMTMDLRLRFDYGSLPPWCEASNDGVTARIGSDQVVLEAPLSVTIEGDTAIAAFAVTAGRRLAFVLSYSAIRDGASGAGPSDRERLDPATALDETRRYWRDWIGRFDTSRTQWPAVVKRSLITLRAMIHQETGGLVAAPTTSLPEEPAGALNWDYRYCWLRDATFTLGAFVNAGYTEEATQWRDWLLRAIAGSAAKMRIMYRVDGSRHLSEWEVDNLPGYRGARPVRIGNAASTQHQIDVYGEVLDCLDLARRAGIEITPHHEEIERRIVDQLARVWNTRGSGIWEARTEPLNYTYSKAMAWAGLDRALRDGGALHDDSAERRHHLGALRQQVHDEVCREGWNAGLNTFTQAYGSQVMDASLLLLPLVGFLPADDPRMAATIARIADELSEGGLIRRHKRKFDGANEGAFLPCSCWMADCLRLQGRHDEAVAQFERLLAVGNDVGLFSEEFDVPGRCLTGNFPQALTHLAIVNTALGLSGPTLNRGGS